MHKQASLSLALLIMAVSGYGVIVATGWPWKAALFPLAIGIPLFCLAAAEALWTLFGSPAVGADETAPGAWKAIAWMLGFFAAIVLLGFPIAVPLFMLLFLRLQGREGWPLTIAMTLAVWGVFHGLFGYLLHLPFPDGWLVPWLGFSS